CNGLGYGHIEKGQEGEEIPHGNLLENGLEAKDHQTPPTLVRVPGWTKPLQSVIDNFGIPSYRETNPLVFMILTFPLIYGLMFGDFGEGPLFFALVLCVLWLRSWMVMRFA